MSETTGHNADYQPLCHVVLYQPEIPFNTGSVGRTCAALGAKLWLVRPLGFQVDDRQLRRAGMDYWRHLTWQTVADWDQLAKQLSIDHMWMFTKKATRSYTSARFASGNVLVFGNESHGLPDSILQQDADRCLRIPIRSAARSLNLSNAVAVAAFEARRQCELQLEPVGSPWPVRR